ncbi:MAG: sulfatase-like hydrolase/transferase [Cocleimonas sp.]
MFKSYAALFLLAYSIIITTKLVFVFYLRDYFAGYATDTLIETVFLGFRFDFALSATLAFIATLFDWNKKAFLSVSLTLLLGVFLLQLSDIIYFNESSRHIGYEIKDALTDNVSLFMTAYNQHRGFTLAGLALIPLSLLFIFSILKTHTKAISFSKAYLPLKFLLLLLSVFFIRGMFNGIPLTPWQASQIGDQKLSAVSLNASYNVLYSLANSDSEISSSKVISISDADIATAFKQIYDHPQKIVTQHLNKPNIVFLFLESWNAIDLKSYGFKQTTTPYFDSLLKKSVRPKGMIAGGHRTTEGLFTSLTSYQNPLGRSVAKTNLQDYSYASIVDILNKDNYSSVFFQGTAKETSGTGAFVQKLGFKQSYGKADIEQRIYSENAWGVYDQDLYNFALKKVAQLKPPFVIGINGATTHDHQIPKRIKQQPFSDDKHLNDKLNALNFSDVALKEFIEKTESLYPNTLFVLLADHCGSVKGSAFENYLIPFALYHKNLKPEYYDFFVSQRDVVPTVLDLLYGDYRIINNSFTGKSLISDSNFVADYYHNGLLGWVKENKALEINIHTQEKHCYAITDFNTQKSPCDDDFLALTKQVLAFTNISQHLLLSGKTDDFSDYKNPQRSK